MTTVAMISSQGQITIPAWIRRRFGLDPNQVVKLTAEKDGVRLTRVETIDEKANYFSALVKPGSDAGDPKKFFEENYDGSRF
jgi:AbrB family looped-hinge helix DNA binding protein